MDVFRLPFVLRLVVACRMSYRNAAERLDIRRKVQEVMKLRIKILVRVYACPYGSETECLYCKKDVLGSCSTVLLPVLVLCTAHPCGLTTYDDCKRCLTEHLCIWKDVSDGIQLCPFSYYYKSPWLVVDCCRCSHGSAEEGFCLDFSNWFGSELAYAFSAVDILENSIGVAAGIAT